MSITDKCILIVAEELRTRLAEPGWTVIDCRSDLGDPKAGRRDYLAGHVPGAVFLDLDEDLAGPVTPQTGRHPLPDPEVLAGKLGALGIHRNHKLAVYDDSHGGVAARAWWVLRWLGHEEAYLLDGGFAHWKALRLPLQSGFVARKRTQYETRIRRDLVISTDELEAAGDDIESLRLLDARDAARFRGEQEPIDPVAGHVPGAVSAPFSDFVREDGTWRPLAERERRLDEALGGDREAPWCVMCGSGVTACHLAISALEAGFREPRLYVGSWSEWIRERRRPVATSDPD